MARNLRRRDDDDRDDERDRDRPRRKKAKKGGGGLTLVLVLLGVAALVGGGIFLIISLSGGKGAEKTLEEDKDRILGAWQGTAPDHPTMTLSLQVFPNRVVFSASDALTGKGKEESYTRLPDRVSGKGLVLRMQGPERPFEWSVTFTSNDEMRVQSLTDAGSPPRLYKRLGKYVAKEERAAAQKRIVGDWDVPRLESSRHQKGVLRFAVDGAAKFDFVLTDGGKIESFSGTWKTLEVEDNLLKMQLSGVGGFDKMGIEFLSDNEIHFNFYSATFTGAQHSAKRLR